MKKKKKKVNERALRLTKIRDLTDKEVINFVTERKSFLKDYKIIHTGLSEEDIKKRCLLIPSLNCIRDLRKEIEMCFDSALLTDRPSHYFNFYLIDLFERLYSDIEFQQERKEIGENHFIEDSPILISYDWILYSSLLTVYQRYLLFEYLCLGYTLQTLAERRYCTTRTITNQINQVLDLLDLIAP